ncbi:choice-of-anchor J domain-containing protein, partial [bacterium]|nr:choice-of-anchor J domain-containing protein [bacterium]
MKRRVFSIAAAVLLCGLGVVLVRAALTSRTPPPSLRSEETRPGLAEQMKLPTTPSASQRKGGGLQVLTSDMQPPSRVSTLPPAPDLPGSRITAPPRVEREPTTMEKKPEPLTFDPQLLSARAPEPNRPSALDMSKSAPTLPESPALFPRRDRDRSLDFVMFAEGFEDSTMPPWGWSRRITSAGGPLCTWHVTTGGALEGNRYAQVVWSLDPQDEWLISPTVDLSSGGPWTLSFWWIASYYWAVQLNNCDMQLRISTDGGLTWDPTVLWVEDSVGVFTTWAWYFASVDLTSYSSYSAVKFAWRYVGADGDNVGLDYIVLADCSAEPQPGDSIEVAENRSDTTFYRTDPDGGCNSTPPRWGHTVCGRTIYGRCFTYDHSGYDYRDLDWYLFRLTESQWVRARVTTRFPAAVHIVSLLDTVCSGYTYVYELGEPCDEVVLDAGCLPAGYYALVVAPSVFAGIEQPSPYRAKLECSPCNTRGETCENAIVILSLPFYATDSTNGHVNDYDEVCPYSGSLSPDVVYEFTPDADMLITVDLCLSDDYDTKVYIYEGSCVQGTAIACNDDICGLNTFRSYLGDVPVRRWQTYYIVVDGYGSQAGVYDLTITSSAPAMCPPNSMHGQVPSMAGALTSDMAIGWQCAQYYDVDYAITEIHFWGIMAHWNPNSVQWYTCTTPEIPMPFLISMYTLDLATSPVKMCEQYAMITGVLTGDSVMNAYPVYEFNIPISMPCQIGQGYISIQASGDTTCEFLWITAPDDGDPGGMQGWFGTGWGQLSYDLSLCLVGDTVAVPECPPDTAFFSQPPTGQQDWWMALSDEHSGVWCADNFSATGHAVAGLRFYGCSMDQTYMVCAENPLDFTIIFREDSLGYPGAVVCVRTASLPGRFTGLFYSGLPLYEFTAMFSTPCCVEDGWVTVEAGGDTTCMFWWLSSGDPPAGSSLQWLGAWAELPWGLSLCIFGDTLILPECPVDSTVFGQTPSDPCGTWNSFGSDSTSGVKVVDDFWGLSQPITEVDFWGTHLSWPIDCDPLPMTARILFYQDAGGQPGAQVCSSDVAVTSEPTDIEYDNWTLYHHRAILPAPCNISAGWVSVYNVSGPGCYFYWQSSGPSGGGTSLQWWPHPDNVWHEWPHDLSVCLVSGEGVALVTGLVYYHVNDAPVGGLVMDITPGDSVVTVGTGAYDFPALIVGTTYQVTPSCSSEIDCDGAISFYDASLAAQYAIGLITLDTLEQRAGDVSGNGDVTFYDASLIAQYAIGLITDFPSPCRWQFAPSSRLYDPLLSDQYAQDYVGICLGDVSSNWAPLMLAEAPLPEAAALSLRPGGLVAAKNVIERTAYSIQFDCTYDPAT